MRSGQVSREGRPYAVSMRAGSGSGLPLKAAHLLAAAFLRTRGRGEQVGRTITVRSDESTSDDPRLP